MTHGIARTALLTGLLTATVVAPPVPEPATWGLMAAGLAVLGAFARRRVV